MSINGNNYEKNEKIEWLIEVFNEYVYYHLSTRFDAFIFLLIDNGMDNNSLMTNKVPNL